MTTLQKKRSPPNMLRSSPMAPSLVLTSTAKTTTAVPDSKRHSLTYLPLPPALSPAPPLSFGSAVGPASGTETEDVEETHSDAGSRLPSITSTAGPAEKKPKKVRKRTYYMRKVRLLLVVCCLL